MDHNRLTWERVPAQSDPTVPTKTQLAAALTARRGQSAIVARHDRVARAAAQVERINDGREFGTGFEAIARQIGSEHRVYAWAI
ncbi:hypothetical protein [Actinoplanes sp. NPDC026623]|uniref:hypothetical protein n=1 Tax=Actinoplanes sp. NPDC026623 TaxID=3155610 RepID=UPI00340BDB92